MKMQLIYRLRGGVEGEIFALCWRVKARPLGRDLYPPPQYIVVYQVPYQGTVYDILSALASAGIIVLLGVTLIKKRRVCLSSNNTRTKIHTIILVRGLK
jgi:hypothetical protein